MLQTSTARHLAADALHLKPQSLTRSWKCVTGSRRTREKTENVQNRHGKQLGFFSLSCPPLFPVRPGSILQLLAGLTCAAASQNPVRALDQPGRPQRTAERTTMPPAKQHLWFSHTRRVNGSATICILGFPCWSEADALPISHVQRFHIRPSCV